MLPRAGCPARVTSTGHAAASERQNSLAAHSPPPAPPGPAALETVEGSHDWQENTSCHFLHGTSDAPPRPLVFCTFVRHFTILSYLTTLLLKVKPPESVSTPRTQEKDGGRCPRRRHGRTDALRRVHRAPLWPGNHPSLGEKQD